MLGAEFLADQNAWDRVFYCGPGSAQPAAGDYHECAIPRGAKWVWFLAAGGGGNGGAGRTAGTGNSRGGGGGGSSASLAVGFLPTFLIPSTLWVQVGNGAIAGGAAASQTWIGVQSTVGPATSTPQTIVRASAGNRGQDSSSGTGGNGGTAPALPTVAGFIICNTFAGVAGQAGATVTTTGQDGGGDSITNGPGAGVLTPGMGGGGAGSNNSNGNGGNLNNASFQQGIFGGGIPGGTAGGGAGVDGRYNLSHPFWALGGTGGGSNGAAGQVGGAGGLGAFGCGGGGGGGGVTGGAGGNGGNGIVIMRFIY